MPACTDPLTAPTPAHGEVHARGQGDLWIAGNAELEIALSTPWRNREARRPVTRIIGSGAFESRAVRRTTCRRDFRDGRRIVGPRRTDEQAEFSDITWHHAVSDRKAASAAGSAAFSFSKRMFLGCLNYGVMDTGSTEARGRCYLATVPSVFSTTLGGK